MSIIRVEDLVKEFKTFKRKSGIIGHLKTLISRDYQIKKAVDKVSFQVEEGEILGVIGPNGAGKSTLVKLLTGILTESSGLIEVLGINPNQKRKINAKNIGVVFGHRSQLYWDLPLIESFRLSKYIYEIPDRLFKENLRLFLKLFELEESLQIPVRKLSLGQRIRGDLALALLHEPKILYLDEPTVGLDVLAKDRFRRYLLDINKKKKMTIFLTTHDLFDLEKLCRHLIILDKGKILYDGHLENFLKAHRVERTLIVDLFKDGDDFKISQGKIIKRELNRIWVKFNPERISSSQIISDVIKNNKIIDLKIEEPEIEEIVKKIYEKIS